ncbi:MAG: FAD-binding oxidoreductase [Marmoricola sp.]
MTTAGTSALEALVAALPAGSVLTGAPEMEKYREDFAHEGFAGMPLAVVRPAESAEVQAAVRWAAEHRVPIVPRGAGTGLSGGSAAVENGITISLERMRSIEIDVACQVAVVEPGALNIEVKKAAAAHGLWYPPDPSSFEICSIGGNVATNAGGLCCVKYGVTADYVLGLEVVLADGTLVTLGGSRIKDVAGLPLLKLFVGSEGTLGVITKAILRLIPVQRAGSTLVARFATMEAASRAVVAIRSTTRPSMLELMDNVSINAVEDWRSHGLDRTSGALLLAQSDAPDAACVTEIESMRRCCEESGAQEVFTTADAAESELFVSARRNTFVALEQRGQLLFEDVGVPIPLLPDLIEGVAEIAERNAIEIAVVAHAGDGNTHPVVVYEPATEGRARAAFAEIMALAIRLGGTITGEHGVGRSKRRALPDQLGADVMALTRRIKDALDPDGILNPGAIL